MIYIKPSKPVCRKNVHMGYMLKMSTKIIQDYIYLVYKTFKNFTVVMACFNMTFSR